MSQSEVTETPEAVVRAYFAALDAGQFEVMLHYMEPESVVEYYQNMLDVARIAARGFAREELKLEDLDLSEILSDEIVERLTHPPPEGLFPLPLMREYAGTETLDQLEDMGPTELLLRHLEAQTPEYQRQQTLREGRRPEPDAIVASERRQLLGAVMEGEDLAHVVFRSIATFLSDAVAEALYVVTLRHIDAGWRITFKHLIPGLENISYGYHAEHEEKDDYEAF